jgi:hypothetical protein
LHFILDRSEEYIVIEAMADFEGLDMIDHGLSKCGVDGAVDVNTLNRQADLPGIEEGIGAYFRRNFGDVNAGADDGWVVTATGSKLVSGRHVPGDTYSSRVRRFNVAAALAATFLPVMVEPVKEILSIPSIVVIQGPKLSSPDSAWTTPDGKHCEASSANLRAVYGVYGDGLTMIVLPMRTAGPLQELKSGPWRRVYGEYENKKLTSCQCSRDKGSSMER